MKTTNSLSDFIVELCRPIGLCPSYTAQLLFALTRQEYAPFEVIKQNFTASGVECIISYQHDEETKPQRYKVTVTPCKDNK